MLFPSVVIGETSRVSTFTRISTTEKRGRVERPVEITTSLLARFMWHVSNGGHEVLCFKMF